MNRFYCFLLLTVSLTGFSQNVYHGTIIDQKSRKPIPFCGIKLKINKFQTMANIDGRYVLPGDLFLTNDTIIISCVGYKVKTIPLREAETAPIAALDPVIYQLNSVDIIGRGNPDYPYQLFDELSKKYRKYDMNAQSKGYFWFLSRSGNQPLELIEEYFNCDFSCNNGISKLVLKNGRLGLCRSMFYSLNTSEIFSHFSLFSLSGNQNIPCSPGNFRYQQLKKLYDLAIIKSSVENGIKKLIIQFHAKKDSSTLFSGFVWIDKNENIIEKIEYQINTHDFYYLRPAIKGDKTDSIKLILQYTFDNSDRNIPKILYASLNYILLYYSSHQVNTIKVASNGNLFIYDYTDPFPGTIPAEFIGKQSNDYQKISCLPYDSLFWMNSAITPQSEEQKQFIDYFHSNGILVNFSRTMDSLSGFNYIRWKDASEVPFSDLLNRPPQVHVSSNGTTSFNLRNPTNYNIDCQIVFNPVYIGDTLHFNSATLLGNSGTYYFQEQGLKATAFINLTFDLYEKQRREILNKYNQSCKSHKITFDELLNIYDVEMDHLKDTLKLFRDETKNGTSVNALNKWYNYIHLKTSIDRSSLINKLLLEENNSGKSN